VVVKLKKNKSLKAKYYAGSIIVIATADEL